MSHLSLDARAILEYLNELGYRNISAEQLKEFITDLRKLIKYEERLGLNSNEKQYFESLYSRTTASFRAKIDKNTSSKSTGQRTSLREESRRSEAKGTSSSRYNSDAITGSESDYVLLNDRHRKIANQQKTYKVRSSTSSDEVSSANPNMEIRRLLKDNKENRMRWETENQRRGHELSKEARTFENNGHNRRLEPGRAFDRSRNAERGLSSESKRSVESIRSGNRSRSIERGRSEEQLNRARNVERGRSVERGRHENRGRSSVRGRSAERGRSTERGRSLNRKAQNAAQSALISRRFQLSKNRKPAKSDPVALYHYYKKEWEHFRDQIPDDSKRLTERWNVRRLHLDPH